MLELSDKEFLILNNKKCFNAQLQILPKQMKTIERFNEETQVIKRNQTEILELKNAITKVKPTGYKQ